MKTNRTPFLLLFLALAGILSACGTLVPPTGAPGISVYENTIYVAYNQQIYALSPDRGDLQWRYPQEPNRNTNFFAPPVQTETGQIIVGGYDNTLYSLNTDGIAAGEPWPFTEAKNRYIGSPLAVSGMIFAPNADQNLYALDDSGRKLWHAPFKGEGPFWAAPVWYGDTLYLASVDQRLYAIDPETGTEKWSLDLGAVVLNSPAVSERGILYLGTFGNAVVAVDSSDGEEIWRHGTDDVVWASPVLGEDDALFVADVGGKLYALDALTGAPIWEPRELGGSVIGTPVILNDRIYLSTEQGQVKAVSVDDGNVLDEAPPFEGRLLSNLAVVGDRILVGAVDSESIVIAFDRDLNEQWRFTPES